MIEPYYQADRVTLYLGDCIEVMRSLPDASVDAIVTDPPYGLEFMGKDWDSFAPDRKNASVWNGRRESNEGWEDHAAGRSGRGGGGPQYASKQRPAKRCQKCGRRSFSGTPCVCPVPEWVLEYQQAAPSAMLAFQAWCEAWAREAYRVLKPGSFLVAFGGTRTDHRLACGIEDAGFEIRNTVAWMFGSGFPKSKDVERAIAMELCELPGRHCMRKIPPPEKRQPGDHVCPELPASSPWRGFGTDLKPAFEPARVARKPLAGNLARNVLTHGTGALNIDGCRIESPDADLSKRQVNFDAMGYHGASDTEGVATYKPGGRWPANVVLDEEAAALLDATVGDAGAFAPVRGTEPTARAFNGVVFGSPGLGREAGPFYGDRGGPSRFFYTAKAGTTERESGLEGLPPALRTDGRDADGAGANNPRLRVSERHNDHPTVKPVSLMRWLVRLATPPGGLILDPFMGSGSTALGALDRHDLSDEEAYRFIGIDITPRYTEIARYRIEHRHLVTEPEMRPPAKAIPQGRLL